MCTEIKVIRSQTRFLGYLSVQKPEDEEYNADESCSDNDSDQGNEKDKVKGINRLIWTWNGTVKGVTEAEVQ